MSLWDVNRHTGVQLDDTFASETPPVRAGTVPGCVTDGKRQTGEGRKWLRLPEWEWLANGIMASCSVRSVRVHRRAWRHHSCGVSAPSAPPQYPTPLTSHRGWQSLFSLASCHHLRPRTEPLSVAQSRFRLLSTPSLTGPGSESA